MSVVVLSMDFSEGASPARSAAYRWSAEAGMGGVPGVNRRP
jgi:hypothetical protein